MLACHVVAALAAAARRDSGSCWAHPPRCAVPVTRHCAQARASTPASLGKYPPVLRLRARRDWHRQHRAAGRDMIRRTDIRQSRPSHRQSRPSHRLGRFLPVQLPPQRRSGSGAGSVRQGRLLCHGVPDRGKAPAIEARCGPFSESRRRTGPARAQQPPADMKFDCRFQAIDLEGEGREGGREGGRQRNRYRRER